MRESRWTKKQAEKKFCPRCGSGKVTMLKDRSSSGKNRWWCRNCGSRTTTPLDQKPETQAKIELVEETITAAEEHNLKVKVKRLESENNELKREIAENENLAGIISKFKQKAVRREIKIPKRSKKPVVAASTFISDTHFDEVVNPAEMGGINAYNREIAVSRLEGVAEKTILMAQEYMSGFEIAHLDLPLGGDMVSGNIHDELARTNEAEIMETVDFWSERLAEVIVTLSKEFPSVFVPCVVGNHGRNTRKPRHKGRVRDNFDWLIYKYCQKIVQASGCKNVIFDIADGADTVYRTFGWGYCLTHGDQASGGTGWGGIASPIMRLYEKKLRAYSTAGQSFDYMIMGHWHQFLDLNRILVNGTTKGYDEYAKINNFPVEPPSQAFWLTSPEWGKILSCPLFVADGEKVAEAA